MKKSIDMTLEQAFKLVNFDPSSTECNVFFMMGSVHGIVYQFFPQFTQNSQIYKSYLENLNRYLNCKVDSVYVSGNVVNFRLNYESACNIDGKVWFE